MPLFSPAARFISTAVLVAAFVINAPFGAHAAQTTVTLHDATKKTDAKKAATKTPAKTTAKKPAAKADTKKKTTTKKHATKAAAKPADKKKTSVKDTKATAGKKSPAPAAKATPHRVPILASDHILGDAARGESYAAGQGPDYETVAAFLKRYPVWPDRRAILMCAENLMIPTAPPSDLGEIYADTKPVTMNGFNTYMNYLSQRGDTGKLRDMVRERWINGPLGSMDDREFRSMYARYLSEVDDIARLDRLIWDDNTSDAQSLLYNMNNAYRALAEARFALIHLSSDAPAKIARVPSQMQDDPGLIYARANYAYERGDMRAALILLQENNTAEGNPAAWWKLRHMIIRDLLAQHEYKTAYHLAANSSLPAPTADNNKGSADYASAEFMAGWLAMRYLNDPETAARHFENLNNNVNTPVSKSRGAYWLGRAAEAAGDRSKARDYYQEAATQQAFFYGQLAMAKLDATPELALPPEPNIPANARGTFMNEPLPYLVRTFSQRGDYTRAAKYLRALLPSLETRSDYVLAAELTHDIPDRKLEVEVAKAANAKNFILYHAGYPVLSVPEGTPERALTMGIIRQESQFDPEVQSSAGAIGLMQMLPSSAKGIAKKHDIPFSGAATLLNPSTNVRLGRAYLADRIEQFDGSYILAIASYNAGQGRVRQWLDSIGDPRIPVSQGGIDPIDWIELIPIYETRNYVQRVLEGTQVYRTRLAGHSAPLNIVQDLRR